MKSIFTIALLLIAFTAAHAQTNNTATENKNAEAPKTEAKDAKATTTPATNDATAKYDDDSSRFVCTNDFYIALVREGVKKG